ncbi:MAG: SAM-dependent methyltransferase [Clostridia bacterium]|nr:SAM-dependent methyltransferase [Clostridia bacterium]
MNTDRERSADGKWEQSEDIASLFFERKNMGHSKKPLDARLRAAADMVLEAIHDISMPCVADIGCDHGFVTAYLIRQRPDIHMIASDISEASLKKTEILLSQTGLDQNVEVICGDGLKVLESKKADAVLIAGMGGETIRQILEEGIDYCASADLFLQANTDVPLLREGLAGIGLGIARESFPEAGGRRYVIIEASKKAEVLSSPESWLLGTAVNGISSQGQRAYLTRMLEQMRGTHAKLMESGTKRSQAKVPEIEKTIEILERVLL